MCVSRSRATFSSLFFWCKRPPSVLLHLFMSTSRKHTSLAEMKNLNNASQQTEIVYLRSDSKKGSPRLTKFSLRRTGIKDSGVQKCTQTHKIMMACFSVCFHVIFIYYSPMCESEWVGESFRPEAVLHFSAVLLCKAMQT